MNRHHNILSLIALVGFLWGQQTASLYAQHAPSKDTKHCLWRVQGKSNTVYLAGSMHFLKKEFYPLAKPIEDAFHNSQIVVFEADIEEMQSPAAQTNLVKAGRLSGGETLKQNISSKTYARLQTYLTEAVGSGAAFDSFTPWMAAVALSEIELQRLGYNPEDGVDNYFFKKAKRDNKEVRGFETLEFQLSLFTGLSKKDQEEMLTQALDDIAASKSMLGEMTDAWNTGDTKKVEKFLVETLAEYPEIHKKLLIDRNKRWIPQIEKILVSGQNAFIVVGTAHLVGKESVVDLLAKKGFKIQQM